MKKFLAVFTGTPAGRAEWKKLDEATRKKREKEGMAAWQKWGETHHKFIKDHGSPLGKTKRIDRRGISDMKNELCAFTVVETETHEEAVKLFLDHPHFSIFPGDHIEIMECLPTPGM